MSNLQATRQNAKNNFNSEIAVQNAGGSPTLTGEQKSHIKAPLKTANNSFLTIYTDWVEFTAIKTVYSFTQKKFTLKLEDTGTAYFRELYTIYYGDSVIGTFENIPRPGFLDPNLVKIKLDNSINYCHDVYLVVKDLIEDFQLIFKNFSRLDYAIDFQELPGFKSVQSFLQGIASGNIRMKGKQTEVYKEAVTYQYDLKLWRDCDEITGVAFGKRISGLRTSIYNKTKELRRQKDKPYIREAWAQRQGFDSSKDVYRLEFSCKKPRWENISDEGETIGGFEGIELLKYINEYANFLIHSNLFYKIKKSKNLNEVRISRTKGFALLMKEQVSIFKRVYSVIKRAANNYKKSTLKHLTFEALFQQKKGNKLYASASWELIKSIACRWQLMDWLRNTFEYLNVDITAFTALDEFTAKELKDWKFKAGSFVQQTI